MLTMEMTPVLDLSIEEVESLDAPCFDYNLGFVLGVVAAITIGAAAAVLT